MFTLVPLNLSDSADLVPVADPPSELAVEPVALKTLLQYHHFPFLGSKPAPSPYIHTLITSPPVALFYVCYTPMPRFPSSSAHVSTVNSQSSSEHQLFRSRSRYHDYNSYSRSPFSCFGLLSIFSNIILGPRWSILRGSGLLTRSSFVPDAAPLAFDSSVGVVLISPFPSYQS